MWCIGALTEEYRQRMYDVLELYARPYREQEPVICIDEKSKQLIRDSRRPLPMKRGASAKYDYEYVRAGTCNVFVAVEPKGGRRVIELTERRTKPEFVGFVQQLLERTYASARKVHLVLDNLNTHFRSCFEEVLGRSSARANPSDTEPMRRHKWPPWPARPRPRGPSAGPWRCLPKGHAATRRCARSAARASVGC